MLKCKAVLVYELSNNSIRPIYISECPNDIRKHHLKQAISIVDPHFPYLASFDNQLSVVSLGGRLQIGTNDKTPVSKLLGDDFSQGKYTKIYKLFPDIGQDRCALQCIIFRMRNMMVLVLMGVELRHEVLELNS